jgi:hypothetical protein
MTAAPFLFSAATYAADATIQVESKAARPGDSVYLRILLQTDIEISALRIPLTMENPWITLKEVSWEYTVAKPYFIDSTLLSDTIRTEVINVLPYIRSPMPTIPPPGGEICRLEISINPLAPGQFVTVDSLNTPFFWVDASDRWGTSIRPDFVPGGILIDNDATAVDDTEIELPEDYALDPNYPNPFNPITQIPFTLPRPTDVTLEIYDILGRKVATAAARPYPAGRHLIEWRAGEQPSGVYFYRLVTPDYTASPLTTPPRVRCCSFASAPQFWSQSAENPYDSRKPISAGRIQLCLKSKPSNRLASGSVLTRSSAKSARAASPKSSSPRRSRSTAM